MRIAIFGGTFNPVHLGHYEMARAVASLGNIDKLLIIPDNLPPHKAAESLVSGEDRLNMCRLGFGAIPKVEISDLELKREGRSYTYDTLKSLVADDNEYYLVCGGDMVETFDEWYNFREILKMAHIIAFRRGSVNNDAFERGIEIITSSGGKITVMENDIPIISSTEIRKAIKENGNLCGIVPQTVADYIVSRGLYK